jgi:hypothetical protein
LGTGFGWYNSGHFPVSYSFTIADFPDLPNYGAQVFWIPNNAMEWGVGDTSIDWNMTNGLVLSISADGNNPPTGWAVNMAAKTNLSGANCNLQITNFAYGHLPVGTWTVTFHNNTDFTITPPVGSPVDASLPPDAANLVSGNAAGSTALTPYFGIQNNNLIGIGHPAVFSNITLNNVMVNAVLGTLSDNFNTGSLDTTKWTKLTDQGKDITVNSGLQWYVGWNMPNDVGYGPLQAAASPLGPWVDFSPASDWLVVNGTNRTATITTADMVSKLGGTGTGYFRLVKRIFTKLQVLLPGETAAPNTPTGKTGTPDEVFLGLGGNENVTVNAVDDNWNIVNSSDAIHLTCSDPMSILPNNAAMSGGTVSFTDLNAVAFGTTGLQTITAADASPGSTIPPATSSHVLVGN